MSPVNLTCLQNISINSEKKGEGISILESEEERDGVELWLSHNCFWGVGVKGNCWGRTREKGEPSPDVTFTFIDDLQISPDLPVQQKKFGIQYSYFRTFCLIFYFVAETRRNLIICIIYLDCCLPSIFFFFFYLYIFNLYISFTNKSLFEISLISDFL